MNSELPCGERKLMKLSAEAKLAPSRSLEVALARIAKFEPLGGRWPAMETPWQATTSAQVRFWAPPCTALTSLKMVSICRAEKAKSIGVATVLAAKGYDRSRCEF